MLVRVNGGCNRAAVSAGQVEVAGTNYNKVERRALSSTSERGRHSSRSGVPFGEEGCFMSIPRSIERFLGDQHVAYAVLPHRAAYTAQEEAALAHVPGSRWAKTVACVADGHPILAVVPATSVIDMNRLRDIAGARDVHLASEREFEQLYPDCEPGAMPPLGPLYGQSVYIDSSLSGDEEIVFDGGTHRDAVKMKYEDFARVVRPTVGAFGRTRLWDGAAGGA
jgi:Ala-tRNA(Pro) deacylase